MKKFFYNLLCLTLVFSLCACSTSETATNVSQSKETTQTQTKDFEAFLDDLLVELQTDYSNVHQLFEHPENYGINMDDIEVSLGHVEVQEEDVERYKELLSQLHEFDYDSLTDVQQAVYDEMEYELNLSIDGSNSDYDLTGNIWSSYSGLQENLASLFSDYILRDEQDVKDLITLINDVPRYVEEAIDYTKRQAEAGMLYFQYDTVLESIQETLDSKEDYAIENQLFELVDKLDLSDDKKEDYKQQIKDAMNNSFFSSYQTMKDELTALKDQVKEPTGLVNIENGSGYYKLLVQNKTGSSESIETIRSNLESAVQSAKEAFNSAYQENPYAYYEMYSITTQCDDVNDILGEIQTHIDTNYPTVSDLEYDLSPLSDELCTEGIVAYCLVPAIDSDEAIVIRYNKRDYGSEANSVDLYTTLAHEGIPGHAYMFTYLKENMEYNIQYFLESLGFTEGFATYAEFNAYSYIDYDSDALALSKYNTILSDMYIALMDIDINYEGLSEQEFLNEYSSMFNEDGLKEIYYTLADNPATYLAYYYGYLQIMNLRAKAKEELGSDFDTKEFNAALLKYGSVNFDIVARAIDEYIEENKQTEE